MYVFEIVRDSLIASIVGFCGQKVYIKVKNWYYGDKDIDINDIKISFEPQTTEDEMVIITRKGEQPEVFKYFSQAK